MKFTDTLATKTFNFDECQKAEVKLPENHFKLNSSSFLAESNIPALCEIIGADNILDATKQVEVNQQIETGTQKIISQARKRSNRQRNIVAPKQKEEFRYNDDEDMEENSAEQQEKAAIEQKPQESNSNASKKKKTVVLWLKFIKFK